MSHDLSQAAPDASTTPAVVARGATADSTPGVSRAASYVALLLVAAIGGGALFMSGFMLGRLNGQTPGTSDSNQEVFRPFWDAYNDVSTRYVGEIDQHQLVQGAIKGIFQALGDPFSSYLTEEEYRASLGGISGEFEGVGIELAALRGGQACEPISETCLLTVNRVIRGSPAIAAGIVEADVVTAVDGNATSGRTLEEVVATIRGPKGTTVVLTIVRGGSAQDIPVVRDVIQREDVTSQVLADGSVGYLKISGFSSGSATDLHDQLGELVQHQHVRALILDLRDDPGGYVDAAQKIASEFVGTSPLYWEQSAGSDPEQVVPTPGGVATDPSLPMVVLVNGGTASASEIVAGSLQGSGRARLVGETTFGKGTIQEFKELPGAGGYRLSVRKWLTPDQRWIHGTGLTPDVEAVAPVTPQPGVDPVLDRAIQVVLETVVDPSVSPPAPTLAPSPA